MAGARCYDSSCPSSGVRRNSIRRAERVAQLRPTILVIEDDPPLKRFLRITLGTQDYNVIEATRGEDGIRQAASSSPDLIILDLGLPDMDGVEVARRLREWSAVPILVVSAR